MGGRSKEICLDDKKTCSKCNTHKLLNDFCKTPRGRFGRHSICKSCKNKNNTKLLQNPLYRQQKNKNNLSTFRERKYGLSEDAYIRFIQDHDNSCDICLILLDRSETTRIPHIDHCHITGKVRGLLCPRCNTALGSFRDNVDYLYQAISYLKDNS